MNHVSLRQIALTASFVIVMCAEIGSCFGKIGDVAAISVVEPRTLKLIKLSIIPILFLLGVVTTLQLVIGAMGFQGLMIGTTLLVVNVGAYIGKFLSLIKGTGGHQTINWGHGQDGGFAQFSAPPSPTNLRSDFGGFKYLDQYRKAFKAVNAGKPSFNK